MKSSEKGMIAAAAAVAIGSLAYFTLNRKEQPKSARPNLTVSTKTDVQVDGNNGSHLGDAAGVKGDYHRVNTPYEVKKKRGDLMVALLGDVGGTNIRLTLRQIDIKTRTSTEVKPLMALPSQKYDSFRDAVEDYLKDVDGENLPTVGVVGIAGEVNGNTVITTNCPHWPVNDGDQIAEVFEMKSFQFINDFAAAGYGVCNLKLSDHVKLDQVVPDETAPKVVMGPGTGLGFCFLTKPKEGKYYEVHSAEAGHSDMSVVTEEDW